MNTPDDYKRLAAEHALNYVQSGMALGLGSGSTSRHMLTGLAERLHDGRLQDIVGVPTSEEIGAIARQLGIPITTLDERPQLDITLDGADEIDPALNLIKGLGGALLREKIVAASSRRLIIMAGESRIVGRLGTRAPLPVEVIPFGLPLCTRLLTDFGSTPTPRRAADGSPFRTDEGNVILDCRFPGILEPSVLSTAIKAIPGVVEHGLFIGMASVALVAGPAGITTMVRPE